MSGRPAGPTGHCWDNALAGPFFAALKNELTGTRSSPSRAAAHTAIFERIEDWHNMRRTHTAVSSTTRPDLEAAVHELLLAVSGQLPAETQLGRPVLCRPCSSHYS